MTAHQQVRIESGVDYRVLGADLHVFAGRGHVHLLTEHCRQPDAEAVQRQLADRLDPPELAEART